MPVVNVVWVPLDEAGHVVTVVNTVGPAGTVEGDCVVYTTVAGLAEKSMGTLGGCVVTTVVTHEPVELETLWEGVTVNVIVTTLRNAVMLLKGEEVTMVVTGALDVEQELVADIVTSTVVV